MNSFAHISTWTTKLSVWDAPCNADQLLMINLLCLCLHTLLFGLHLFHVMNYFIVLISSIFITDTSLWFLPLEIFLLHWLSGILYWACFKLQSVPMCSVPEWNMHELLFRAAPAVSLYMVFLRRLLLPSSPKALPNVTASVPVSISSHGFPLSKVNPCYSCSAWSPS